MVNWSQVKEDLEKLQKLRILIDYDDQGYLLQVRNLLRLVHTILQICCNL